MLRSMQNIDALPDAGQVRAARGMLGWSQGDLSEHSKVSLSTVRDFEAGRRQPMHQNLQAIRVALEAAGVEFIPENGGGAGVRRKKAGMVSGGP
ncbi:helix-turn-helix domain-containing protein (plasmid) [Roseomonas mucosa]|uniref:helix-turn-helix domain-containing protein n=2 Tax=Roseomonas mucosa TaxID=207340 RepID=UPI0028CE37F4|nr:helix-turn-helix domain-containing protein [Roseomonas mucosa]MDT8262749.1 helix-turn-helix domain-containing protein [Roseomonas sp. DSM 102946]MDT8356829.1 helix-turn-helix domain-containing protein [Roseomonas mucosa]